MATSPRHRGWRWDNDNTRLDVVVDGTEVGYFNDATADLTLNTNGLTVTAGGITVTAGDVSLSAGLTIGATSQLTISVGDGATNMIPEFQIQGTGQVDSSMLMAAFSTTATRAAAPTIALVKGGAATITPGTIVTDDEILGSIIAYGDDGNDLESPAAAIEFAVDNAPGTGDMPGRIAFYTTANAGETLAEHWRITEVGEFTSLAAAAANVAGTGTIIASGGIAFTDVANAHIDDSTHGNGTTSILIGNETITSSSDIRLKTDIEETVIAADAVGLLEKMRIVDFAWNDPPNGRSKYGDNKRGKYVGMIAQETEKIAPWIINNASAHDCDLCTNGIECDEHESYWFVNYGLLVPTLIKAIQELNGKIAVLES